MKISWFAALGLPFNGANGKSRGKVLLKEGEDQQHRPRRDDAHGIAQRLRRLLKLRRIHPRYGIAHQAI